MPGNDFWLFDDTRLLVSHFAGNGDWVDSQLVADPGAVRLCRAAFTAVWELAVPHSVYRGDSR